MAFSQPGHSRTLKEELTCPLCLDIYRSPHMLPCGHNFCKKCLEHLKRQAERGRFCCPECRESHRCSAKLQKNFKLANISDDFRQRCRATTPLASVSRASEPAAATSLALQHGGSTLSVPCDYCPALGAEVPGTSCSRDGPTGASACVENGGGEDAASAAAGAAGAATAQTYAVKTCLKCEVSMCPEHLRPHLELPAFREHLLTEPMGDLWKRKCPAHDEMYRYYCMDDKVCVCDACTIEGGHSGHRIKTLKNTMKDLKGKLDKQLCRVERKYSLAEKKLQEQKKKERQNKKCMDDCERSLAALSDELRARMSQFAGRLQQCSHTHWNVSGSVIKKNISRINQDQARLQEVSGSIERLLQENDPFSFIEAYKTTGKQCRRKLRKNMFYPEYVDMDMECLGEILEMEMNTFLHEELPRHLGSAFTNMCHLSDVEGEEHAENDDGAGEEEEEGEEEDEDDDSDDLDDTSAEEMRSDQDEEEEEEEDEGADEDVADDDLFSPDEEIEEEEDLDEEEEEEDNGEEEEEEEEENEEDVRS